MAPTSISITAPARLHFGLLSFGDENLRQFGGAGLMLREPSLQLRAEQSEDLSIEANPLLAQRVANYIRQWQDYHQIHDTPRCKIQLLKSPDQHTGLGLGTQLGLSVVEALNHLSGLPVLGPSERATVANRAKRSAVGTYGFQYGGFIVERGRVTGEPISSIDCRLDFPTNWKVLLIQPREGAGLSGSQETDAFESVPVVPRHITERLIALLRDQVVPAITAKNFDAFTSSIEQYGMLAGSCFASIQGGPYNGPDLNNRVSWLKQHGARGVGQSSWGPTLFCFFESQQQADDFQQSLPHDETNPLSFTVVQANNEGAAITV